MKYTQRAIVFSSLTTVTLDYLDGLTIKKSTLPFVVFVAYVRSSALISRLHVRDNILGFLFHYCMYFLFSQRKKMINLNSNR